jgi:signal transduction histidine kinase
VIEHYLMGSPTPSRRREEEVEPSQLRRLRARLLLIGAEPEDVPESALRKSLLVVAAIAFIAAGLLWGALYASMGLYAAAAIPGGYGVLSLASLGAYAATHLYRAFLYSQLLLILVLPVALMLMLGDFQASSAVILWAVLAPVWALLFDRPERAPRWAAAFLALLVASPIIASYLPARAAPPPVMATILFVLNIGCVSGLVVALLYYFVTQRDLLLAQREEAHIREIARAQELERAYTALEAVQAQLIHAEKMASLGRMVTGVAHELKNPLNFVNNFAELSAELVREIREEREGDPQRPIAAFDGVLGDLEANAAKVVEHGRRADGIVRGMLAHGGGRAGERREADVHALLDDAVETAFRSLRAGPLAGEVVVERRYDERAGRAVVVPEELRRAFVNLLDNAFYAVRERALVSAAPFEPRVVLQTRGRGEWLEVRIVDNGTGIAEANLPRVFEPFFTTKPTGTGTGLGLSLAYEIVTGLHGGRLTAQNEEGAGAAFTIELPTS